MVRKIERFWRIYHVELDNDLYLARITYLGLVQQGMTEDVMGGSGGGFYV